MSSHSGSHCSSCVHTYPRWNIGTTYRRCISNRPLMVTLSVFTDAYPFSELVDCLSGVCSFARSIAPEQRPISSVRGDAPESATNMLIVRARSAADICQLPLEETTGP